MISEQGASSVTMDVETWSEHRKPPVLKFAILIVGIAIFWVCYMFLVHAKCVLPEADTLRKLAFVDLFRIIDFGDEYKRFTPLGLGLWGYLDMNVLVPLLGRATDSSGALVAANRLLPFHILFSSFACACGAFVSWKIFRSEFATILAILLIGLNDAVPFQFRYGSTLLCYQLQAAAIFSIYFLVVKRESPAAFVGVVGCVVFSLLSWEQGLDLAFAILVYLAATIFLKRRKDESPIFEFRLLSVIVVIVLIYLILRIPREALPNNKEASFFFSYGNPLLMFDDLLLNFSALVDQSVRQIFPFPGESFSVILKKDMNQLNPYNLVYSQFPNMPYRMFGLWLSGFSFAVFWVIVGTTMWMARQSKNWKLPLLSLSLFVFGFVIHLPIMHRDYFYIPGYALGYKATVSYVGFVFTLLFLVTNANWPLLSDFFRRRAPLVYVLLAAFAVVRSAALALPQRFPW